MRYALIGLVMFAVPAFAQSATEVQMQRNNFMSAFAQCDSSAINLQQQIAAKDARIKTLEDKYEPKADEPKK